MKIATAVQLVKTMVTGLEIKATKENCDKVLGIHALLDKVAEALNKQTINVGGVSNDNNNQQGSNVHGGMDCHTSAEHPETDGAAADGPDHGAGGGGI